MKSLMALVTAVSLSLPPFAHGAVASSDPQFAVKLLDQYVQIMNQNPGGSDAVSQAYGPIGQTAVLAQAVNTQLVALEPEDFNLFMFYFADRYIHHPEERKTLFDFMNMLRDMIKSDLESAALLRDGPADAVLQDSYKYGSIIMLLGGAMLGWRAILASPLRTNAFVKAAAEREIAVTQASNTARIAQKILGSGTILTVGSLGVGSIAGLLEYFLAKNRTHRLDPAEILMVVQAEIGCDISYSALDLEKRYDAIKDNDQQLQQLGPSLKKDIDGLAEQASLLRDQFPRLAKLSIDDRLFRQVLQVFPKSDDWQKYKQDLNDTGTDKPGQCRQVSMSHVLDDVLSPESSSLDNLVVPSTPAAAAPAQAKP